MKVDFEHSQEKYSIKRSLLGMICDGEEIEQLGSVCLTVTQSDGNAMNYTRNDEINLKVNAILDKRVREYFLFDGEKIERLTRTTRNQKKEVEIGIKNLLNILIGATIKKDVKNHIDKTQENQLLRMAHLKMTRVAAILQ